MPYPTEQEQEIIRSRLTYCSLTDSIVHRQTGRPVTQVRLRHGRRKRVVQPMHYTVWFLVTGVWPDPEYRVVFVDGDRENYRYENLELELKEENPLADPVVESYLREHFAVDPVKGTVHYCHPGYYGYALRDPGDLAGRKKISISVGDSTYTVYPRRLIWWVGTGRWPRRGHAIYQLDKSRPPSINNLEERPGYWKRPLTTRERDLSRRDPVDWWTHSPKNGMVPDTRGR
jgi:hypothetical protein